MGASRRAVFLDKDGTLVEDVPWSADPASTRLLPGAREGVAALARAGYRLFIVSNQPGVARGCFPEAALTAVARRLEELVGGAGACLSGFYYCPHDGAAGCACRKPSPGMIVRACREHGLDPARSWMVGDILDDVEAGRRAGCRTVMIDNGHETEWVSGPLRAPHFTARDLEETARRILAEEGR